MGLAIRIFHALSDVIATDGSEEVNLDARPALYVGSLEHSSQQGRLAVAPRGDQPGIVGRPGQVEKGLQFSLFWRRSALSSVVPFCRPRGQRLR